MELPNNEFDIHERLGVFVAVRKGKSVSEERIIEIAQRVKKYAEEFFHGKTKSH